MGFTGFYIITEKISNLSDFLMRYSNIAKIRTVIIKKKVLSWSSFLEYKCQKNQNSLFA